MSGTTIKKCVKECASEYQDSKYGKGNRVHNVGKKVAAGPTPAKCTVCGNKKD